MSRLLVLPSAEAQSVRTRQGLNPLAKVCLGSSAGCSPAGAKKGWLNRTASGAAKTEAALHEIVPSWRGPARAGQTPAKRVPTTALEPKPRDEEVVAPSVNPRVDVVARYREA